MLRGSTISLSMVRRMTVQTREVNIAGVKVGGGNAGHNGLRSITAHIGNDYKRVRLGIGHPGAKELVHPFVLGDFAKSEMGWVSALCDAVARSAALLAKGDDAGLQNKVHLAMEAAGYPAKPD